MKTLIRLFYGAGFLAAGIAYSKRPNGFKTIGPAFLPFREAIVATSGMIEIIYGAALLLNRGTSLVTKTMPAFLAAVFPANVYMAAKNIPLGKKVEARGRMLAVFKLSDGTFWAVANSCPARQEPLPAGTVGGHHLFYPLYDEKYRFSGSP
ncbi:hypothetical protein [Domibacillus sp.]|uniref:hypothetical protein n=1 Tax=Domibacillus sp. TaxID=1969783 RepID=UPI002811FE0A|nr:hypothetical protein [Domibacillus sp.]